MSSVSEPGPCTEDKAEGAGNKSGQGEGTQMQVQAKDQEHEQHNRSQGTWISDTQAEHQGKME